MNQINLSDEVLQYVISVNDYEFAEMNVGTLACSFKTDRFKLSRQFKKKTGMTLEDFLLREKMTRAALLLSAHENIPVKEISRKVGFCTCDYFIRKFRKYYGIAPGRYRVLKSTTAPFRRKILSTASH